MSLQDSYLDDLTPSVTDSEMESLSSVQSLSGVRLFATP